LITFRKQLVKDSYTINMETLKPTVKVLETPLPQVNSDWDTPQLPLLELRVKPEPEAM
jgi:hypothetical protein